MKKLLSLTMAIIVIAATISVAYAASTGSCGENTTWTLDDNGVLTISGTGKMYDYSALNPDPSVHAPWDAEEDNINTVVIEEGIEHIGNSVISGLNIKKIYIPHSVTSIGGYQNANNAVEVYYNGEHSEFVKIEGFISLRTYNPNISIHYHTSYDNASKQEIEATAQNDREIRILINNKFLETDQPPVMVNDRTLVPMRAIFEALGAEVKWDDKTQTASGTKNDKTVSVSIGQNSISVNGKASELDVPAQLIGGRTMIPVRAVAEAFDCQVSWNDYQKYVIISPSGQQTYKIEAVNDKDEVLATAHFNDKGQLTNVDGSENTEILFGGTIWFMPMLANINGNCYIDRFSDVPNSAMISYDGNNVSEIEVIKAEDRSHHKYEYYYNSDNCINRFYNALIGGYSPGAISRAYSSDGKKISSTYVVGSIVNDLKITFTLNDWGLVEEYNYNMSEPGESGSLTYDSKGNLTHWTAYFGIDYVYDVQNRLTRAIMKEVSDPIGTSVTYRYINE